MESTSEIRSGSPLGIDLNQTPSPPPPSCDSQALAVVRNLCRVSPAGGAPAALPSDDPHCAACSEPLDDSLPGLVCDACDRPFHLACCADMPDADDWRCGDCLDSRLDSKRWTLGRTGVGRTGIRLLDINALPLSDGEGEAAEHLTDSTRNSHAGTETNLFVHGNTLGLKKAYWTNIPYSEPHLRNLVSHIEDIEKNDESAKFGFPPGRFGCNDNTAFRLHSQNPSEMYLLALREFITERHGVLEDGWHVEVRSLPGIGESFAVFYSPEGKAFQSIFEVACFLGLISAESDRSSDHLPAQRSFQSKEKKSSIKSMANGYAGKRKAPFNSNVADAPLDVQDTDMGINGYGNKIISNTRQFKVGDCDWQHFNDDLPIQYEDFFIISLGKIDARPLYHDSCHIWPIGYRSCWHDKITGSLFICEVMEGGDEGPVFKIRRCSCSAIPIPVGSSVVYMSNQANSGRQAEELAGLTCHGTEHDHDDSVQQFLIDPCPPLENEIMLCLTSDSFQNPDFRKLLEVGLLSKPEHKSEPRDDVGELLEEGRVLSSVWKAVCKKLIDSLCQTYKQTGDLKGFCHHSEFRREISCHDSSIYMDKVGYASLTKLFGSLSVSDLKSVIQLDSIGTLSDILTAWLEQDRLGLDVHFVREIIEQLPGISACSDYKCLSSMIEFPELLTVKNGCLLVQTKSGVIGHEHRQSNNLLEWYRMNDTTQPVDRPITSPPQPPGKQIGSVLPPELVGDVLQVSELFCRFHAILGLSEPLTFEELEKELMCSWLYDSDRLGKYGKELIESTGSMFEAVLANPSSRTSGRCQGAALTAAHCSMLKLIVAELLSKVAFVDPNVDASEHRSKRARKRDAEGSTFSMTKLNMLPVNEYTWSDIARRYILAVIAMDGNLDSAEITSRERGKVFRCLQGDGGVLYGSLTGVAGMEGDALLLTEAAEKVFSTLKRENDILVLEEEVTLPECERQSGIDNSTLPEWALVLEPVRKLPTNVGTRIRNRVYDALSKDPPEWARDILQHSISKEVYKGNASGPTKKAVISVLDSIMSGAKRQGPALERKRKNIISIHGSDIIANQCRIILRRTAAEDEARMFCNLLGRKMMISNDNDDEGLIGCPAMVSRPLDFRTIDLRLAAGAYKWSPDSFLEDVRELWNNVRSAFGDQPELLVLADTLSTNFDAMYEKEVLPLVEKLMSFRVDCSSDESKKELKDIITSTSKIPKAPWDEGVCKVCGIDKDDDSVLLCDTCDAEYHRYCLNPPLAKIPEGNWYCPSCIAGKADSARSIHVISFRRKYYLKEYCRLHLESLANLAASMEEKDYWKLDIYQRVLLLKFLCDELLNTAYIRQHLEMCADTSLEMQQKLRSISSEWKNLKIKEDVLMTRAAKAERLSVDMTGDIDIADGSDMRVKKRGKCTDPLDDKKRVSFPTVHCSKPRELIGDDKGTSVSFNENMLTCENRVVQPSDTSEVHSVLVGSDLEGHHISLSGDTANHCCLGTDSLPFPTSPREDATKLTEGTSIQNKTPESRRNEKTKLITPRPSSGPNNTDGLESALCMAYDIELNAMKCDLMLLQDSVMTMESQILDQNIRREFLGCDSLHRLYWVSSRPGRLPWVVVDISMALLEGIKTSGSKMLNASSFKPVKSNAISTGGEFKKTLYMCGLQTESKISSWVSYQSDDELEQLIEWLSHYPKDRELKESILHIRRLRANQTSKRRNALELDETASLKSADKLKTLKPDILGTRASTFLGTKHKPDFDAEHYSISRTTRNKSLSIREKMYRCDCLEVCLGRHHCFSCHRTFCSDVELAEHIERSFCDGVLVLGNTKSNGESVSGNSILHSVALVPNCTAEKSIIEGLNNGNAYSSVLAKFLGDSLGCPFNFRQICSKLLTNDSNKEVVKGIGLIGSNGVPSFVHGESPYLGDPALTFNPDKADNHCVSSSGPQTADLSSGAENNSKKDYHSCVSSVNLVIEVGRHIEIPQSSLKPLVGDVFHLLRNLKINLLDMDAALPNDAFRPSKAQIEFRWAWRAFVKSAQTIFEMVQATIVLEDMIKTEYLENCWWYWSSLTAAAKVSSISSLALRIYALDAAIIYDKDLADLSATDVDGNLRQANLVDPNPFEKTKASKKLNRKRKELDG